MAREERNARKNARNKVTGVRKEIKKRTKNKDK